MNKKIIIIISIATFFHAAQAQKKAKSILAGLFISFPPGRTGYFSAYNFNNAIGLEVSGQYNFTNKSAVLIQSQLSTYSSKIGIKKLTFFSIQGGYRYFISSGFFINLLGGINRESGGVNGQLATDSGSRFHSTKLSSTLGAGKRFMMKRATFIDAGIEYIGGPRNERINIKGVISILRRPKKKDDL